MAACLDDASGGCEGAQGSGGLERVWALDGGANIKHVICHTSRRAFEVLQEHVRNHKQTSGETE